MARTKNETNTAKKGLAGARKAASAGRALATASKTRGSAGPAAASKAAAPRTPAAERPRDPRLPAAGTVLIRPYKGKDYRVTVLDAGFRYDGREFRSLSKVASEITGQASINGFLWMRLAAGPTASPKKAAKPRRAAAHEVADGSPAADAAPAVPPSESATI